MTSSKNKILLGLLTVASVIMLTLGLLFYTLSSAGISASNSTKTSSGFTNISVEQPEAKDVSHFSIFSILNKIIPN